MENQEYQPKYSRGKFALHGLLSMAGLVGGGMVAGTFLPRAIENPSLENILACAVGVVVGASSVSYKIWNNNGERKEIKEANKHRYYHWMQLYK